MNMDIRAINHPLLSEKKGHYIGENMAAFSDDYYELFIVNMDTGKIRQFSDAKGNVLVDDKEIDLQSVINHCENGSGNARFKLQRYSNLYYRFFECGFNFLCWTLYPDGRHFADEDGYGAANNYEEKIYAVINRNLEIIKPFSDVKDIASLMDEYRNKSHIPSTTNIP